MNRPYLNFTPQTRGCQWKLTGVSNALGFPFVSPSQFDLAGSARVDVLVSDIHPKQASQIIKELSALLPLEKLKVSPTTVVALLYGRKIRSSISYTAVRILQVVLLSIPLKTLLADSLHPNEVQSFHHHPDNIAARHAHTRNACSSVISNEYDHSRTRTPVRSHFRCSCRLQKITMPSLSPNDRISRSAIVSRPRYTLSPAWSLERASSSRKGSRHGR